ncbi:MAG TPA: hypothetical protein VLG38_08445 [Gammaproteobacteria bacterium]|nr:hypothetical protein [Gammaproteobacteria bacterium]
MRKPDNKLVKTMMLGTLAFIMMCSCKVYAKETVIVKCTRPAIERRAGQPAKAAVSYQDFACADNEIMEVLKVETHEPASEKPGLREYEKVVLKRTFIRQMLERILNS